MLLYPTFRTLNNDKLGIDPREKIAAGILVKAILINGLEFVSRPLYLFSQFFEDLGCSLPYPFPLDLQTLTNILHNHLWRW
jgi:hypothetical protein